MRLKFRLLVLVFCCLAGVQLVLDSTGAERSSVFFENKDAMIRYENYRSCKQCQAYEVVIFSDGRVLYTGKSLVNVLGEKWYQIDPQEVVQLSTSLVRQGFFELQDSYVDQDLADGSIAEISFRHQERQKTVQFHYAANMSRPKPLVNFAIEINAVTKTEQLRCPADLPRRTLC
jgi:hypothetical protein